MARIRGTKNNDILDGTDDADTLMGRRGDDLLNGGLGNDKLKGGKGNAPCVAKVATITTSAAMASIPPSFSTISRTTHS